MAKSKKIVVPDGGFGRRGFLKNAAASAAGAAPAPTAAQLDRDAGNVTPPAVTRTITRPGSDLMVQTVKDLGIEYVAANPGSSFEGLQESFINYGNPANRMPEF